MAVRSVAARDELYESEASEDSILFCQLMLPQKSFASLSISGLFYFAMPTSCFVSECHQKRAKNITSFPCKGK